MADGAISGEDEVFGVAGVAGAGMVGGGAVEEVAGFVIVRLLAGIERALGLDFVEVVGDFPGQVNFLWRCGRKWYCGASGNRAASGPVGSSIL